MKRTIQQYIDEEFAEGSKPHHSTVIRWINAGKLTGVQIGSKWYVTDIPVTSDDRANEILKKRHHAAA